MVDLPRVAKLMANAGCGDDCAVWLLDQRDAPMLEVQHRVGGFEARMTVDWLLVWGDPEEAREIIVRSMRSAHAIVADREARKQGRRGGAHVLEV